MEDIVRYLGEHKAELGVIGTVSLNYHIRRLLSQQKQNLEQDLRKELVKVR